MEKKKINKKTRINKDTHNADTAFMIGHKHSMIKYLIKKSKLRDWKLIERSFKRWANPDKSNCIAYYSPTSQEEILMFFKKHFIK